jgi:hypothetical protein
MFFRIATTLASCLLGIAVGAQCGDGAWRHRGRPVPMIAATMCKRTDGPGHELNCGIAVDLPMRD